jgi:integrase
MRIGDAPRNAPANASPYEASAEPRLNGAPSGSGPETVLNASALEASRAPRARWTQEHVRQLRYDPQKDPRGRGNHYLWEGRTGLGMRCYKSGHRTWVCATTVKDSTTQRPRAYFVCLGEVRRISLAAARRAAQAHLAALRGGLDPRAFPVRLGRGSGALAIAPTMPESAPAPEPPVPRRTRPRRADLSESHPRSQRASDRRARKRTRARSRRSPGRVRPIGETSLKHAIAFYVANRNCAPRSKRSLVSTLQNLRDWMRRPLLSIDAVMLKRRYHEVIARVQAKGASFDARWRQLPPPEQLLRARPGYLTGIKAGLDTVMSFGRVFKYWVKMHHAPLLQAGTAVPDCPAQALVEDLIAEAQRVKSLPPADLRTLVESFADYPGNPLHTLLARFLLATGLRVGITLCLRPEHVKADRIEIPAHTENSKIRWNRRHLAHLAKIVPLTPEIEQILNEIRAVAPNYGDASAWLFPSRTSRSGHMEEVKAAVLPLRQHSAIRFTMHQFRHNFATAAEELGFTRLEITELLGQATGYGPDRYIDERVQRHRQQLLAIQERLRALIEGSDDTAASVDPAANSAPAPAGALEAVPDATEASGASEARTVLRLRGTAAPQDVGADERGNLIYQLVTDVHSMQLRLMHQMAERSEAMRATLDLDDDVLNAANRIAREFGKTAGAVLSDLARRALSSTPAGSASGVGGVMPFESRGGVVTNEHIDRLREEDAG